jgi:hypothetical protein
MVYPNMLLRSIRHVRDIKEDQPQSVYQWDFYQPLITQQQAQSVFNTMLNKISGGLPTDGSLSGTNATVGGSLSLAGTSTVPGSQGVASGVTTGQPASILPGQ